MKTTQAILKSQDLLPPKYNKHNIILKLFSIGGDNLCDKKRKNTKSQFLSYISTLKRKTGGKYLTTQYNNINVTRYTYSRRKT